MSMKFIALSAALASFALVACDSTTSPVDPTAALEAYSWKLSTETASPAVTANGSTFTDIYNSQFTKPCDKHTITKYRSDFKVINSTDSIPPAGTTGCSTDSSHTWKVAGSTLTTISTSDTTTYTVASVSTTSLQLTWAVPANGKNAAPDSIAHTVTSTFTAK